MYGLPCSFDHRVDILWITCKLTFLSSVFGVAISFHDYQWLPLLTSNGFGEALRPTGLRRVDFLAVFRVLRSRFLRQALCFLAWASPSLTTLAAWMMLSKLHLLNSSFRSSISCASFCISSRCWPYFSSSAFLSFACLLLLICFFFQLPLIYYFC